MQNKDSASAQCSTLSFEPFQIFSIRKVGNLAVQCFKFDEIFKISTKIQHYLLHSELVFRLNELFYPLCTLILALNGMWWVNKWPCGCAVSNFRVRKFQISANFFFWKIWQYTRPQREHFVTFIKTSWELKPLFCSTSYDGSFRQKKVHPNPRS